MQWVVQHIAPHMHEEVGISHSKTFREHAVLGDAGDNLSE